MAKSIREQIAAAQAKIVALQASIVELEAKVGDEVNAADIVTNATVTFQYGKGDTKRELSGMVLGVKQADPANPKSATMIRVAAGEGFDAPIVTIYVANVTKVTAPVAA